jgi:hypothetical protein
MLRESCRECTPPFVRCGIGAPGSESLACLSMRTLRTLALHWAQFALLSGRVFWFSREPSSVRGREGKPPRPCDSVVPASREQAGHLLLRKDICVPQHCRSERDRTSSEVSLHPRTIPF